MIRYTIIHILIVLIRTVKMGLAHWAGQTQSIIGVGWDIIFQTYLKL